MAQLNSSSSSSSSVSPSPVRVFKRPSRSRKLPAKLRELQHDDEVPITFEELELEQSSKYSSLGYRVKHIPPGFVCCFVS